jgi:hypothetical protein
MRAIIQAVLALLLLTPSPASGQDTASGDEATPADAVAADRDCSLAADADAAAPDQDRSPEQDADSGQEPATRAGKLRKAREEKARSLRPPEPGRVERALQALETGRLLERILNPAEGIYPRVGTVTPGSAFSGGPAYRRPGLLGGHADLSAMAMVSLKGYWIGDARLTLPRLADGRVFAEAYGRTFDFKQEPFFGLGPDSARSNDSLYALRSTEVGASGGVRPVPWLSAGGSISHLTPNVRPADHARSIDRVFDTAGVPGFAADPRFVRTSVFADLNYREPRGNPRQGGRYYIALERFDDRTGGGFSFDRFEADLQQYVSLYRHRRVLALRGLVSTTDPRDSADVPFYLQRTLGGPDDLRGFRRFRFRDRHLLLLQAEYRWEIFTAVDGALFYDAGTVAPSLDAIDLGDLESDYGIGFRFGTATGVFLRIEGAFGSSGGKHFVFRFGHVF